MSAARIDEIVREMLSGRPPKPPPRVTPPARPRPAAVRPEKPLPLAPRTPRAAFEGRYPWTPEVVASFGWTMVGTLWVSGRLILLSDGRAGRTAPESMLIDADRPMDGAANDG